MSKDVVAFAGGSLPANPSDLESGLQNVQQTIQGSTGGMPLLRLLKSGIFVYGAENIEVEEGSEWAINPYSLMHGFACWGDGELLDERMVPFTQTPPVKGELPDLGQSWDQQVAMQLQCISGEDTGTEVLYKGTSTGLRNAVKELINQMIAQLRADQQHCVPIVELESDSYTHKKYGEIFYPVLQITRWVSMDGNDAPSGAVTDETEADETDGDEAAGESEPETKPRRRRAGKTSKAAAKDEKPATARRRRRRAS